MRRTMDRLLPVVAGVCAFAACAVFAAIAGAIAWRGLPAVNWEFLSAPIASAGASGGIFYNLVGTLVLVGTALAACAPVATGVALVHGFYLRGHPARRALSVFLQTLNGMPSILLGLAGLVLFVKILGWGKSWLAGGLLLGLMILPTVSVALAERIASLPDRYLEAAAALGLSRSQVVRAVVLPQSVSGLVTGSLLGLARAAGETAPIMFTATVFAGVTWPHGVKESPVLSLPYHLFVLAQESFDPAAGGKVWGTALVLLLLVSLPSLAALPARLKIHEEA